MIRRTLVSLAVIATVTGCTSPEATRARAGGPGADVGNRGEIELHAGSNPYHGTPVVIAPRERTGTVAASPRAK